MQAAVPPPVYISPAEIKASPRIDMDGKRFVILGLTFSGPVDAINRTKAKLVEDGWKAEPVKTDNGTASIGFSTQGRSLEDVKSAMRSGVAAGSGQVTVNPFLISEPDAK